MAVDSGMLAIKLPVKSDKTEYEVVVNGVEEKECVCGHLNYEHVDPAEYNESTCFQCKCQEFKETKTS